MPTLRLVLDTNAVLMPIARENSGEAWLREAWRSGQIVPLISADTETELLRTLREPRFETSEEQAVNLYIAHCVRVEIPDPPPETPQCRDPDDQAFLILAYQAGADYLVTRDNDLLVLKGVSEIPIITPPELGDILQQNLGQHTPVSWE